MGGKVAVAYPRADQQPPVRRLLDAVEPEVVDVDKQVGPCDTQLHQVDEVGPACERRGSWPGENSDGGADIGRPLVGEGLHAWPACSTAGTMFA